MKHTYLIPNEEREAVLLLKKANSTSTEKGIIHLATGGTVKLI